MKTVLTSLLIGLALQAQAVPTLQGDRFTVIDEGGGGTWFTPGKDTVVLEGVYLESNPAHESYVEGTGHASAEFRADPGYIITGFSVLYDFGYRADPYIVTGNEDRDFAPLRPGDTWLPSGWFQGTGVPRFEISGSEWVGLMVPTSISASQVYTVGDSRYFSVGFSFGATGLGHFCTIPGDPISCDAWLDSRAVTVGVFAVHVTPRLVAIPTPIPEPATYALMAAGLALVGVRRLKFRE